MPRRFAPRQDIVFSVMMRPCGRGRFQQKSSSPGALHRGDLPSPWILIILLGLVAWGGANAIQKKDSSPKDLFPNLIDNGDFEASSPPLKLDTPQALFIWDQFSHGEGKKSLFINASLIEPFKNNLGGGNLGGGSNKARAEIYSEKSTAWLKVNYRLKKIKPGKAYLFEIYLMRDHNIDGLYPIISLAGQEVRISDFWAAQKWQRMTLFFKLPPQRIPARQRALEIKIPAGDYRLWMDDLSLKEFKVQKGSQTENVQETAASPNLLSWDMPATDRLLEVKVFLSQSPKAISDQEINSQFHLIPAGAEGPRSSDHGLRREEQSEVGISHFKNFIILSTTNVSERRTISIPRHLPKGKWFWRVAAYQYRTLVAASEIEPFSILQTNTEELSSPSALSRSDLANDRESKAADFFPIGIYHADTADFKELSEAGFNAVQISPRDLESLKARHDSARLNNLRILLPPWRVLEANVISKSETILAWYLDDEPEGRSISPKNIFLRKEKLHGQGLFQPGAIALNRSWRAPDYASAVDIFMSDPYPVPFEPLSWLGQCLDEIHSTIAGDSAKRLWAVIQAFDWNSSSEEIGAAGLGRLPTTEEVRALTWLALIHRARGLFYFAYRNGSYFIKDKPSLWKGLRATIREVREAMPMILAPEVSSVSNMECDSQDAAGLPAVHFILKELENDIFLMAINMLERPVTARFIFEKPLLPSGQTSSRTLVFSAFELKIVKIE